MIWRLVDPQDHSYAYASTRGTWKQVEPPCCEADSGLFERVSPLIMEWEPGSDVVGDFTWVLLGNIAVRRAVFNALQQRFPELVAGSIEMIQDNRVQRPKRVTRRTRSRVWLPYEGPELCDLVVTTWMHADLERSSLRVEPDMFGRPHYELEGVEHVGIEWDPVRLEGHSVRYPREVGKGLVIAESDLHGAHFFRVYEAPFVCCTQVAKEFIEQERFSNIDFYEVGDLV